MATAVVDVAAFSIVPFKADEEAIGGTTLLSVVLNTSSVPPTTSPPAADSSLLPAVARFRGLRSRKGFGRDMKRPDNSSQSRPGRMIPRLEPFPNTFVEENRAVWR